MYPVNDYLILEELDGEPAEGLVLYKPPTDSIVRKYRVVRSDNEDYQEDNIIAVMVKDIVPFFDQFITKAESVVAEVRGE